jgi:hypothetical protein
MIARRDLVTGSVLGGMLGALGPPEASAANATSTATPMEPQASEQSMERIARAIVDLRSEFRDHWAFPELAAIRELQKRHLRSIGKFPDYIEVGVDVWLGVHDWHIRWQHPMVISRDSSNRLTLALMQTLLILRSDAAAAFIGQPYDNA